MPTPRVIGLIVVPASGRMPAEAQALYGDRDVGFITEGLGLGEVSPGGFQEVEDRILDKARALRHRGAEFICLMGTSLTFYRGANFTDDLRERIRDAGGVPATTMSHAIVDSLAALGIHRVAVATSYIDELNDKLKVYLADRGFEVTHLEGLGISGVDAMRAVTEETLIGLSERTTRANPAAEGLLISCTGLQTLGIHVPLERSLGIPVTSSAPAGFWHIMRTAGFDPASPGHGRLFEAGAGTH